MMVLYAEDDLEDFNIFNDIIQTIDPSVQVMNVRNGTDALEFLEHSAILPDYVFLDINMPTMDGKSCLKYIKKDKRFSNIPVIIYTTSNNKLDIELCNQLGATDFIQKPVNFNEGVHDLHKFFKAKVY